MEYGGIRNRSKSGADSAAWGKDTGEASYGLQGEKTLCSLLEQNSPALICCGHTHWSTPWVQWNGASNAVGKIIILTRAEE
ncbi:hypothetical protein LQV63_11375 [Paenibacillus profundus]|uniref:Calcineurin-like phosphoesterase domain-containing protein n=1 Tax=Paenibacillus profundus TaxID=1173085 RepID=A0ABS8YI92_9BACL|nr:hypothetical protein [Paenibacillus profundus]